MKHTFLSTVILTIFLIASNFAVANNEDTIPYTPKEIIFNSNSRISGAYAQLYFDGYGTVYDKDISKYTATDEEGSSLHVRYADDIYLLVDIDPVFYSKSKTTIILTYSNGDTGTARFVGSTYHPGPFLDAMTTGHNNYCEGDYATLIASGASSESVIWQTSTDNSNWVDLEGQMGLTMDVLVTLNNTYYRFKQAETEISNSVSIIGHVCCSETEEKKILWTETFSDSTFTNPDIDRFRCPYVQGHTFKPSGKVDDGYYVVVAKSDAANPALCAWPSGKYDHTSGNGTSGFLIINAGADKKIMYEQEIIPQNSLCEGVSYNFSLFATNMAESCYAPARFAVDIIQQMNDGAEIKVVDSYDTGAIDSYAMEQWIEYTVSFIPSDVNNINSLIIRLWNTGGEISGNDVVIDDLSLYTCMPIVSEAVESSTSNDATSTYKELCDGKVIIVTGDKAYNLSGAEVK